MRRPCPDCEQGARCQACRDRLRAKQARRRARLISQGAPPVTVWGHARKTKGGAS